MRAFGKILLGLLGSAVLTVVLLVLIGGDNPYMYQAMAWLSKTTGVDAFADSLPPKPQADDDITAMQPSIQMEQNQMVYQPGQADHTDPDEQKEQQKSDAEDTDAEGTAASNESSDTGESTVDEDSHTQEQDMPYTFETVDESYFDDALFIGDSRTVGMQQSGLLPNATYYAKTGIGIRDILSQKIVSSDGMAISVKEALKWHEGEFGKVYIMIGINDMSSGDVSWFAERYEEILSVIRDTQPEAVIYIQGNIPMSYWMEDYTGSLNNENLRQRNERSRAMADDKQIFYLDTDKIYADEAGNLIGTYTTDGLHVQSKYYDQWIDYLKNHAIIR